jgi:hypothetical protein
MTRSGCSQHHVAWATYNGMGAVGEGDDGEGVAIVHGALWRERERLLTGGTKWQAGPDWQWEDYVDTRAREGSGAGVRALSNDPLTSGFKQIQNSFKFDLIKKGPFQTQKIWIKYWAIGVDKRNNFSYCNLSRFKFKFELKFREDKMYWNL